MEAVLEHPETTLAEIIHNVYCMSKRTSVCFGKPFLLLEKKPFQSVEGLSYFFGLFAPASLSRYAN